MIIDVDITAKPVGSFFGGKYPRSMRCGKCGAPGLLVYRTLDRRKTSKFVHSFTIKLNENNEPEITWGPTCGLREPAQRAPSSG